MMTTSRWFAGPTPLLVLALAVGTASGVASPTPSNHGSAVAAASVSAARPAVPSTVARVAVAGDETPLDGSQSLRRAGDDLPAAVPDDRAEQGTPSTSALPGARVLRMTTERAGGFSAVAVTWTSAAPVGQVAVQIRTQRDSGEWGAWSDLPLLDVAGVHGPDGKDATRVQGTESMWTGPSTVVEVAVTKGPGAGALGKLEAVLIDPGTSTADETPQPTTSLPRPGTTGAGTSRTAPVAMRTATGAGPAAAAAPAAATTTTALAPPAYYSRGQWGADESIASSNSPTYMTDVRASVVHHTADANGYSAAQVPAILRSIYAYHVQVMGWSDMGYNALVDSYGRIWEGRRGGLGQPVWGAHALGFNQYTFGVSMMGNYSQIGVPAATLESVAQLIAWKFKLHNIDPRGTTQLVSGTTADSVYWPEGQAVTLPTIFGHRDVNSTACPGTNGYAQLPWIRERAAIIMLTALPAPPVHDPQGAMEHRSDANGLITTQGWAVDQNMVLAPSIVTFTLDGKAAGSTTASGPYPALLQFGIAGDHGFRVTMQAGQGIHTICMTIRNIGAGKDVTLPCNTVSVNLVPIDPVGAFTASEAGEPIRVTGWAYDGSVPSSSATVDFTIDAVAAGSAVANASTPRPSDSSITGNRGFTALLPTTRAGTHQVCATIRNVGGGTDKGLGCQSVRSIGHDPVGTLRGVGQDAFGQVTVTGWAWDQSQPLTALTVMVTVNDKVAGFVAAGSPYVDNLAAYGIPGNHGWNFGYTPTSGTAKVCAFAFNVGVGTNTLLGCTQASFRAPGSPIGGLEAVRPWAGHWIVSGWAWDPSAPLDPVTTMITVDGKVTAFVPASSARPELASFGIPGNHGYWYATTTAIRAGQTVCLYAFNIGAGENQLFDCKVAR